MQNFDEGYIKYAIHWKKSGAVSSSALPLLISFRNRLHAMGLIGAYENGIGFGNISCRLFLNQFLISGTQTGEIQTADANHFSLVESCNIEKNELVCTGPVKASSEALTHFAFYASSPHIHAVIHIHHLQLWQKLLFQVPVAPEQIAYGTPEMANEITRMIQSGEKEIENNIIVTAGHREGIFTFGETLQQAYDVLMRYDT